MEKPIIGIFRTDERAKVPEVAYEGTSGAFDIFSTETITINPGERKTIPNGIKIAIPKGYYLTFHPKSGLYFKQGMRVFEGLIDFGYAGDLSVMCENHGDKPITIEAGNKYVQVRVFKIPEYEISEIDEEEWNNYVNRDDNTRKEGGFGSSGL